MRLSLLLLVFISISASAQKMNITLNGHLDADEYYRMDTSLLKKDSTGSTAIFLRHDEHYYYLNVHTMTTVNVLVYKNDTLHVIHASGSLGRIMYTKDKNDSAVFVKGIRPVIDFPNDWDNIGTYTSRIIFNQIKTPEDVQRNLLNCLDRNGYVGTTIDMALWEREFVFKKSFFEGSKILVSYKAFNPDVPTPRGMSYFPVHAAFTGHTLTDLSIFSGDGNKRFKINTNRWMSIQ